MGSNDHGPSKPNYTSNKPTSPKRSYYHSSVSIGPACLFFGNSPISLNPPSRPAHCGPVPVLGWYRNGLVFLWSVSERSFLVRSFFRSISFGQIFFGTSLGFRTDLDVDTCTYQVGLKIIRSSRIGTILPSQTLNKINSANRKIKNGLHGQRCFD